MAKMSLLHTAVHTSKTFNNTIKYLALLKLISTFIVATHPQAEAGIAGCWDKFIERQSEVQVERLPACS